MPKHKHDCDGCIFVSTISEMDVYMCPSSGSIIARFSDDGPDYASTQLSLFFQLILGDSKISVNENTIPFRDYVAGEHACEYHRAWLTAIPLMLADTRLKDVVLNALK